MKRIFLIGLFLLLISPVIFAADGVYTGTGSNYAEWFEKEGDLKPKDLVGLNVQTGQVRSYQPGDVLIGVVSLKPLVIGNRLKDKSDDEMRKDFVLVSLMGEVDVDAAQIQEKAREVLTPDGQRVGYRLSSGRVLLRIY